jgi:hypothetical protein
MNIEALTSCFGLMTKNVLTEWENPLICTELRANSHMSQEDIFQTWVAMLYSSMRGSLVKWNCSGSSVDSEM